MKRFVVTPRARLDLRAIWKRIRDDAGIDVADRVLAKIYGDIQAVAHQPGMGHVREDVDDSRYRFWSVYKYVIAYRTDLKPLTISRVVHGARDFKRLLRKS